MLGTFSPLRQIPEPEPILVDPFFDYKCTAEVNTSIAELFYIENENWHKIKLHKMSRESSTTQRIVAAMWHATVTTKVESGWEKLVQKVSNTYQIFLLVDFLGRDIKYQSKKSSKTDPKLEFRRQRWIVLPTFSSMMSSRFLTFKDKQSWELIGFVTLKKPPIFFQN